MNDRVATRAVMGEVCVSRVASQATSVNSKVTEGSLQRGAGGLSLATVSVLSSEKHLQPHVPCEGYEMGPLVGLMEPCSADTLLPLSLMPCPASLGD